MSNNSICHADQRYVTYNIYNILNLCTLEAEIHLNSRTFILPGELEEVLDLSAVRLNVIRDNLEARLREKRTTFEKLILFEKRRMDGFRVKETREMLTLDELKERVETVDELFDMIEKLSREAKAINVEEHLLQLDISPFSALAEILEKMEPIEKLWNTAYEFEKDHQIWYHIKNDGRAAGFKIKKNFECQTTPRSFNLPQEESILRMKITFFPHNC
uniref:Uncharacterized protein n=1 Tax=Glossina pallidipes TaxID=7398 RepID=A0A1A9ZUF4_GLOPL